MPRLFSTLQEQRDFDFETERWLDDEYRTDLVDQRKALCSHTDALEIRVPTILCESCFAAEVDGLFVTYRGPDVLLESWESDLAIVLDDDMAASIAQDEDSPRCHSCRRNLHGEPLYVEMVELAERLGIAAETSRINPSKRLTAEVFKLYGRKCFGCGSNEDHLTCDHIKPKSRGGTAVFQNLQPLCKKCNVSKGDGVPRSIVLVRYPFPSE